MPRVRPFGMLIAFQCLIFRLVVSFHAQQKIRSLFSLLVGQFFMVAGQMSRNGNSVRHKISNYCTIQTQNDCDIHIEERQHHAEKYHRCVVPVKGFLFCLLFFKLFEKLFSGEEA
jgi:hypothetical protein